MARLRGRKVTFNDHPFTGEGYSVYGTAGTSVQYRNLRLIHGSWVKGGGGNHDVDAKSVLKTARRGSQATGPISVAIPSSFASTTSTWDVRHYEDDVEAESDNYRTRSMLLNANRTEVLQILGTGQEIGTEARAGGIVRIRFAYKASRNGIQPTVMRALATAGPTSPDDATVSFSTGYGYVTPYRRVVEVDTPVLSAASAYTYTIRAENSDGTVTKDLITGISVQAVAAGPAAATLSVVSAV
jgi:hypothetical protein